MILRIKNMQHWNTPAHRLLNSGVMNKLLALGLSLPLMACVIGSGTDTGGTGTGDDDGSGSGSGSGSGGGGGNGIPDRISTDTTWTGAKAVNKAVTVDPGVKLTIAAGTSIKFGTAGSIAVKGTVDIQGAKGSFVTLAPAAAGGFYPGFTVPTGGQLNMSYVVQTGAEIYVSGGTFTAVDSQMSNASGDLLVVDAGTVDMSYSAIGLEPGAGTDTTHCDLHFGGAGTAIKITHSNISSSSYGLMLYGGSNVDLTNNNWFNNKPYQIDTTAGVSGIISGSWFDTGAPTPGAGATLTAENLSATRLPKTLAGPRLD
jgi:hypothetical protein